MADVIARIKLDSGEFDSKIKRAAQGLLQMEQECRKVGGTLAVLEKDQLEFVKGLGQMETVSKNVRGKLGELTSAYTELSVQYKRLTEEEKRGDYGKALSSSLQQLKTRILETKTELNDVAKDLSGSKFGQFGSVIDTIGQKMGVTGNITELLTSKTAMLTAGIGASVAIIGKATEAWVKYNDELAKQDQMTTVITGLKGDDADNMTDSIRAMVDTYNVDFRQAVEAANTLMSQFGESGDSSIQLLRDGLQGMIQGDGPKLLQMIQQYAPAFRDAGVSASQLVAVIQNSEGGIFTSENMNAIVMGIKNIRLMTNATSEALSKLGIDGEEMSRKMSEGSMTVFDALKEVAGKLKDCASGSQEAGQVMQQVFGRQGAMAGTNLAKAIEGLNLNLEETKRQTGEVGEAYDDLYEANKRLETAIRECFGYDGWEQMATGIKTQLVDALSTVLELTLKIKDSWIGDLGNTIFDSIGVKAGLSLGPLGKVYTALSLIKGLASGGSDENAAGAGVSIGGAIASGKRNTNKGFLGDDDSGSHPGLIVKPTKPTKPTTTPRGGGSKSGSKKSTKEEKDDFEEIIGLIPNAEEAVKSLQEQIKQSWDEGEIAKLTKDLQAAEKELQRLKNIGKESPMVQGLSGFNAQTMGAWMQGRQKDLSKAEYGSADYTSIVANIADMNTIKTVLEQSLKAGIDAAQFDLEPLWEKVFDGENIPDSTWQSMVDVINEKLKEMNLDPIKLDFNTGGLSSEAKKAEKSWQGAALAVSAVGSAIQNIEDPAAKIIGTVAQAIATVALGYAEATKEAAKLGPWAWIAFAATGLATMVSTIATIHSATGYAKGGIVEGNSYSGDNMMFGGDGLYGLNAGELVLTKAQQSSLAQSLSGNGGNNVRVHGVLRGKDIFIAAENWSKSVGKGELVTW
jgi:hypothetical protein